MVTNILSDAYKFVSKVSLYDIFIVLVSIIFPRSDNIWTFESAEGKRFDGNSKYLYLHCENKEEIKNVWISSDPSIISSLQKEGLEAYGSYSIRGKYYLLRSDISFSTHGPGFWKYLIRSNLVFLHHGIPLKLMNEDDPDESSSLIHRYGNLFWNRFFLTTSMGKPFELFAGAYLLTESNMIVGRYPRTDPFFSTNPLQNINLNQSSLNHLKNMHEDHKIVFYTPTFRKEIDREINAVDLFLEEENMRKIDSELENNNTHLYISLHPMRGVQSIDDSYENISLLKTGGDIYPFLKYCDVMITDFSSIFYDYLLLERPIIFFAPDYEEYNRTQGMYFNYNKHVPGPVAETVPAVISHILDDNLEENYMRQILEMKNEYYVDSELKPSEEVYQSINRKVRDM